MTYSEARAESVRHAIQHSKMRYILYRVFTDTNANHGYVYLTSDLYTSPTELKKGSWDLTLGDARLLGEGKLSPIFIEIKSSFKDNEKLVKEIVEKIQNTELLIDQGNEKVILDQIAETGQDGLELERTDLEYVIFIPGSLSKSLIDYITKTSKDWKNKTGLVVWSYDKKDADGDVIHIPYFHRDDVKFCRNKEESSCNLCLCVHGNKKILNYLKNSDKQELEKGRIMPSRHKYVDPVVNIISILSVGKLFKKTEKCLGQRDLTNRMRSFFHGFRIFPTQEELDFLFSLMFRAKIILGSKGPIKTFHLNKIIADALGDERNLTEEIINRTVKYKLPQTFLEQFDR
jgi:hypothetical protein